jgi:hypothetical protein
MSVILLGFRPSFLDVTACMNASFLDGLDDSVDNTM